MDLPVKFPSETEVILEDVARFRALSPRERIQAIEGLLADRPVDDEQVEVWFHLREDLAHLVKETLLLFVPPRGVDYYEVLAPFLEETLACLGDFH